MTLGSLLSISNAPSNSVFYGPCFYENGTFGPGQCCAKIRTVSFVRGKDGKRHRVGTRTRHTCRVPPTVTSTISVTFAAS